MTNTTVIFAIAVGVIALLCYVAARRSKNRRVDRASSGDSAWSPDTGYRGGDDGHHHGGSAGHSGPDHAGPCADSTGGDGSGGGDAGGSGDGGGGGGGGSD